jgi:hypothetical protein
MTSVRALLLASALALPVTVIHVATAEIAAEAKAKKVSYKTCGTYKYWKGGKCLDARDKAVKK